MAVIAALPYNPNFDYEQYFAYRSQFEYPTLWSPDNLDHMRLPGNTDTFELCIYIGKLLHEWLTHVRYRAEMPVYEPAYSDIIYSLSRGSDVAVNDSPHIKVPPVIAFNVIKRRPASMKGGKPFGDGKHWKFRHYGDFQTESGDIYRLRARWWESIIEFAIVHRSGAEAEWLCTAFEKFMDLNEGKLLEAGVGKIVPWGRDAQPDPRLDRANVHYRKTSFYVRTQEFQFAGPITAISDVEIQSYQDGAPDIQ